MEETGETQDSICLLYMKLMMINH